MTQPLLLAMPDSDIAPVAEDAVVACEDAQARLEKSVEQKLRADIAELLFCIEARKRGYEVKWMSGGCKGYDVILERDGVRPMFVQVKHTFLREQAQGGSWFYKIKNGVAGKTYANNSYDVLAVYMWDRGEWVFYTRGELGNRSETTYTPPELRKVATSKSACAPRDPNNWHLLDEVAAQLSQ